MDPKMAMPPGIKPAAPPGRRSKRQESSPMWNLLAVFSVLASVVLFVGVGLKEWRVAPELTLHLPDGPRTFPPSSFGLYLYQFGENPSRPWTRLRDTICTAATSGIIGGISCRDVCSGHFRTRCQVYQSFEFWGLLTIGIFILGGSMGILAAAWLFIFGPSRTALQIMWFGGGAVILATAGTWVIITDSGFKQLSSGSVFPYANLSFAAYLTIAGGFGLLFCGLLSLFVSWLQERAEWRQKQEVIRQQMILGDPYASPFGGPALGMPGQQFLGMVPQGTQLAKAPGTGMPGGGAPFGQGMYPMGPALGMIPSQQRGAPPIALPPQMGNYGPPLPGAGSRVSGLMGNPAMGNPSTRPPQMPGGQPMPAARRW